MSGVWPSVLLGELILDIRALIEQEVTAQTVDDFRRLIGQLSSSAPLLSEADLRPIAAAQATTVFVAIDGIRTGGR